MSFTHAACVIWHFFLHQEFFATYFLLLNYVTVDLILFSSVFGDSGEILNTMIICLICQAFLLGFTLPFCLELAIEPWSSFTFNLPHFALASFFALVWSYSVSGGRQAMPAGVAVVIHQATYLQLVKYRGRQQNSNKNRNPTSPTQQPSSKGCQSIVLVTFAIRFNRLKNPSSFKHFSVHSIVSIIIVLIFKEKGVC